MEPCPLREPQAHALTSCTTTPSTTTRRDIQLSNGHYVHHKLRLPLLAPHCSQSTTTRRETELSSILLESREEQAPLDTIPVALLSSCVIGS
eukprot:2514617-Amphidinium_carterae.1